MIGGNPIAIWELFSMNLLLEAAIIMVTTHKDIAR